MEARSCNHRYSEKAISITHSECVSVALVTRHAMRKRHVVICGLPRSILFFTLSHKRQDLRNIKKKVAEHKISV